MKRVQAIISDELYQKVKAISKEKDRTVSYTINKILYDYFKKNSFVESVEVR